MSVSVLVLSLLVVAGRQSVDGRRLERRSKVSVQNWDAVKGSVSGNILNIESQNSESTATISWLVIGERQDEHMYDTEWTDDNGKVIVEPLK